MGDWVQIPALVMDAHGLALVLQVALQVALQMALPLEK
jgi:hypothetical protein